MATAAQYFSGYTGTLGRTISARRRREPKYSKQQQARMIRAILSRRMMSPPSYEDVLDYVDSNVTYAENKKEVLAVFGERSRRAQITTKDLEEMRCTSLHNKCASNGLDSCQVACDECSNPAACKKADKIEKEIKKHGRELTGFERMQTAHEKEAKRAPKKAKYSTGQTVKCREGYELQCGFTGSQKITQVKRYPDYVMYGIRGKAQGFVEEDWIVGAKVKPVLKEKKKVVEKTRKAFILSRLNKITPTNYLEYRDRYGTVSGGIKALLEDKIGLKITDETVNKIIRDANFSSANTAFRNVEDLKKSYIKHMRVPKKGVKKTAKITKPKEDVFQRKRRWNMEAVARMLPQKLKRISELETVPDEWARRDKAILQGEIEEYYRDFPELRKTQKTTKKKAVKPPKPTPAKVVKPSKKTTRRKMSNGVKVVKPKLKKPTGITLHSKTLTDAQIKHAHKYGYVNVTIDGVKKRVTKRNYAPRKRIVQWYKSGGKVCLKVVRR